MENKGSLLLKAEEVADELRMSRATVYEMMRTGELASITIGRSRRVARAELVRYVDSLTEDTAPASA